MVSYYFFFLNFVFLDAWTWAGMNVDMNVRR